MPSGLSTPANTNSLDAGVTGSELPRLTEARTLTEVCGASRVDSSDLLLTDDDDFDRPIDADDPVERYPDGEFE